MIIDTEKKLQELENEIKALKATYTISGGAIKTYFTYSETYTIIDVLVESPVVLKFTSLYGGDRSILITSFFVQQTTKSGNDINLSQYCLIQEQKQDGTVTIEIPLLSTVDAVRVGLTSSVPGTFTRIV